MASSVAEVRASRGRGSGTSRGGKARKALIALAAVLVLQGLLALCLISAQQLLVPRNTPFGVAGRPSAVVAAVTSRVQLDTIAYPSESAAANAISQGKSYGAYISGSASDTLIVVPAKSFFGQIELEPTFLAAAHRLGRPVTVQTVKPLPQSDRTGAVAGLLLLPLLVGGLLAAIYVFKAAGRTAAARWRAAILAGYSFGGAVLTDLIAGPLIGAYPNSHFWPLLPCFALVTAAVVLAAAAIQGLAGRIGTPLTVILFFCMGGAAAGGAGTFLLPIYWRNIGVLFPPQNGVTLIRNVLYFGGNDITTPLVVLSLYAVGGTAVIGFLWMRRDRAAVGSHARADSADGQGATAAVPSPRAPREISTAASPADSSRNPGTPPAKGASVPAAKGPGAKPKGGTLILAALALCAVLQCLFSFNYMSAGHAPVATNMPFGVTGSSPLLTEAEKGLSLKVTHYPDESAVKTAIRQTKIWGALVPAGTSDTLIVVPSISDLAPYDLTTHFDAAAKSLGQPLNVEQYQPTPLAKKDPFGLVEGLMLPVLLLGAYISATMLRAATGTAVAHWRAATLLGNAIVAGLAIDLIAGVWLQGYPSSKFWIVWPILSLVIFVVSLVAAVLQRLVGAAGTVLTALVIVMFGNPSSGGATGVPYLPTFWRDIGPYLPPRNAYILLRQTIYFSGHGTTHALVVLLIYLGVAVTALAVLDWFRINDIARYPDAEVDGAAMTVPIGAAP